MVKCHILMVLIMTSSCLLSGCFSNAKYRTYASDQTPVRVILMAGQSNMEGAGNFDELSAPDLVKLAATSKRITISYNGKAPRPVSYTLSAFKLEKYGFERSFGPEVSLAISLSELYPEDEFMFVKTTRGGTSLYGAWSPNWTAEKALAVEKGPQKQTTSYYALHMQHVENAMAHLNALGKDYEISAVLWLQGENDAGKKLPALSYGENLNALIAQFRSDMDSPELPFVMGQINSTYGRFKTGPEIVRKAMVDVAGVDNNTRVVLTSTSRDWDDFPKHSDNVHYNTVGQMRWGRAFAVELESLRAFK